MPHVLLHSAGAYVLSFGGLPAPRTVWMGENTQNYNPFQAFLSLQNVLTSLKAAMLALAVRVVDLKKCNQPFPCREFQSN